MERIHKRKKSNYGKDSLLTILPNQNPKPFQAHTSLPSSYNNFLLRFASDQNHHTCFSIFAATPSFLPSLSLALSLSLSETLPVDLCSTALGELLLYQTRFVTTLNSHCLVAEKTACKENIEFRIIG